MIKNFKQFNEMVTSQDMKNALDLGIEKSNVTQPNQQQQKNANLKVTDIQNKINQLNQQKQIVNQELINLQNAQRDLMPNNPGDPQNALKQKIFMNDQQEKLKIQQQKLKLLDDEIKNLQDEIGRNKEKYL